MPGLAGNEHLEEVVSDVVVVLDLGDTGAHDGSLLLEHSDGSVDLDVYVLSFNEALHGEGHLVSSLFVENDLGARGAIGHIHHGSHGLLVDADNAPANDDVLDLLSVELEGVIESDWGVLDHFHGHWHEESGLPLWLAGVGV